MMNRLNLLITEPTDIMMVKGDTANLSFTCDNYVFTDGDEVTITVRYDLSGPRLLSKTVTEFVHSYPQSIDLSSLKVVRNQITNITNTEIDDNPEIPRLIIFGDESYLFFYNGELIVDDLSVEGYNICYRSKDTKLYLVTAQMLDNFIDLNSFSYSDSITKLTSIKHNIFNLVNKYDYYVTDNDNIKNLVYVRNEELCEFKSVLDNQENIYYDFSVAKFIINSDDTLKLHPGLYYYDVKVKTKEGKIITVVPNSSFVVRGEVYFDTDEDKRLEDKSS